MLPGVIAVVVFAAHAFLAVTLIIAGTAKLADRTGFALTLVRLGVSTRGGQLERAVAALVPLIELGVGFLLISGVWPILADAAALALMLIFNGVIGFALRKAPGTACRCFGALSNARFGWKLLLRSAGLTMIAVFVLSSSGALPLEAAPPWLVMILIGEYVVLAAVAAHAVRVVKEITERMAV